MVSANATGTANAHMPATTRSYTRTHLLAKALLAGSSSKPMYQPVAQTIWKAAKISAQSAAA
jgi:hypothetical protein